MTRDLWGPEEYDAEAQRRYDDGDFDAALDLLGEALLLYPDSVALRLTLAYTHLAVREYAWARRAFERTLELEPDHEEALVGLGDALLKLGERVGAFLAFDRVRELGFGDDPDLMLAVGRSLYREEMYERALLHYRRAGESAAALAEAGYCLSQMDRREEAARHVVRALERDPGLHEARAFLGNLRYEAGEYEEALAAFRQVPASEMWDPLAVWRTVELLRGLRDLPAEDPAVEPYLEQLERLGSAAGPVDRLLAEVASENGGGEAGGEVRDRDQLDLFVLNARAPRGREPDVHTVRTRDGRLYTGDWRSIVEAMRDRSGDPTLSVAEFMRETARLVRKVTGMTVPEDDPEAFVRASARAGIVRIER